MPVQGRCGPNQGQLFFQVVPRIYRVCRLKEVIKPFLGFLLTYRRNQTLLSSLFDSGYYRRYLPKFVYVKSVLDSGAVGEVTSVNLRLSQSRHKFEGEEVRADWRVDATNAGGGLFMDLG